LRTGTIEFFFTGEVVFEGGRRRSCTKHIITDVGINIELIDNSLTHGGRVAVMGFTPLYN